jgi:very-short-patch-repair endonuclease
VHFHHVENGIYDRGRSRTNRIEAKVVAERVISHLRDDGHRSIGVVTFSVAQTEAVLDELEKARAANPDLEEFFTDNRLDGVFVKNLEAVQGDERDVIVFSVGYARDEHGKFTMAFGPLTSDAGPRRLNVAVTRARQQVEVVSSVRAHDFSLTDSASAGARLLKDYLEFAEKGPESLRSEIESLGGEYESPFEESVADAVRALGYEVLPQVGVGGFRIDLGVIDPNARGQFTLGIECDGATYHSSPTARDRDRLRQEVLERLGWRIHRIWSWDWVRERRNETDRLREAIEASLASSWLVAPTVEIAARAPDPERMREAVAVHEIQASDDAGRLPWVSRYELADLSAFASGFDFHDPLSAKTHLRGLAELLRVEAPVSIGYAIKRLAAANGISRRGGRVMAAGTTVVRSAIDAGLAEQRGEFLWRPGQDLETVRIPDPAEPATRRSIEDIALEELEATVARLREASGALDKQALVGQAARVLGFSRTGPAIQDALEKFVEP